MLSLPLPLSVVLVSVLCLLPLTFSVLWEVVPVFSLRSRKSTSNPTIYFVYLHSSSIIYGYFEIAAREGDIGAGLKGLVPGS